MTGAPIISKAIGRPEFLVCPKDGSKWSKDLAQKRVGGELYYGEPPSCPRCGAVLESEKA